MMSFKKKFVFFLFVFTFISFINFLFVVPDLFAQKRGKKEQPRVIRIKELVIRQRVIKPQAMLILSKSQQARIKSDIVTSQNFSSRIIETVREDFLK
ncbi:MAG: hypothetical protein ACO2PO_07400 [Candidatus Calescibacterium sp.]